MRSKHLSAVAVVALLTVLVAGHARVALGATGPTGPLTFETGPLTFETGLIGFQSGPLDFPSGFIATETASTIEVTLPADILFDFDKSDVRPDAQGPLHELALMLREKARGPVAVQGYTDALGVDAYNQRLSERRAAAVRTWLAVREGLMSVAFTTAGFGARNPVAANRNPDGSDNPAGRQMNRRVTLIISK
jgi:outer membrane protein OmpA-like peptidoglycan-associated protein